MKKQILMAMSIVGITVAASLPVGAAGLATAQSGPWSVRAATSPASAHAYLNPGSDSINAATSPVRGGIA